MPDVQGRCPACGGASLFLGEGGHVTCSRIDCPAPSAADELLHGLEDGVLRLFRGDFGTRLIRRALEAHEPRPSEVRLAADAAARAALGAPDDAGLLDPCREKASGRPTHPDGTPYRYHEIVAEGWEHCDGCRTWGQRWTAENPHDCPGTYVKGPSAEEAPREP